MKTRLMSLTLLIGGLIGATAPLQAKEPPQATPRSASAVVPDPARQVEELARLFRAGDVAALARAMVPPTQWERLKLAYEFKRLHPISDEDRAAFAEKLAQVTAPDAVDTLMLKIEPELEKARPQVPGALLMGFGAMQLAVASPESDLTEDQRAVLEGALPGIQHWASSTDFLSSATMRDALTLLTDAARRAGIQNLDQLMALPLEEVLYRAGTVLAAAKDAVRLYGIDLDAVADSLRVDVISIEGDTARVRTTITLFDAPVWAEHDLVLVEGNWYGKQVSIQWIDHDLDGQEALEDLEG